MIFSTGDVNVTKELLDNSDTEALYFFDYINNRKI